MSEIGAKPKQFSLFTVVMSRRKCQYFNRGDVINIPVFVLFCNFFVKECKKRNERFIEILKPRCELEPSSNKNGMLVFKRREKPKF